MAQPNNTSQRKEAMAEPDRIRLNRRATVTEKIRAGQYRVHYEGSYWPAYCPQSIDLILGASVLVVGMDGIVLLIEPTDP